MIQPSNSAPTIHPRETKVYVQTKRDGRLFTSASSIIAKRWKNPNVHQFMSQSTKCDIFYSEILFGNKKRTINTILTNATT